jgi:hypothetical protein
MDGWQLLLLQIHQNHRVLNACQALETVFPPPRQFVVQDGKAGKGGHINLSVAGQRQPRHGDQIAWGAGIGAASDGPLFLKRGDPFVDAVRAYGPCGHYISHHALGFGILPGLKRHPPPNDLAVMHRLKSKQPPLE